MRPDISALLRAKTALRASEEAERAGDMALAIKWAYEAMEQSAAWREAIMRCNEMLDKSRK